MLICPDCKGSRRHPTQFQDLCPTCKGRGRVLNIVEVCEKCNKSGKNMYGGTCQECKGEGFTSRLQAPAQDPVEVPVSQVQEVLGYLIDIQTGDYVITGDALEGIEDPRALVVAGALVGFSLDRSDQGFPKGWFLNNIIREGGVLILDSAGIWHQPDSSEYGVMVMPFPTQSTPED